MSIGGLLPLPATHGLFHGATYDPIEFRHLLETRVYLLGRDDSAPGVQLLGQCIEQLVLLPDHGFVVVSDGVKRTLRSRLAMTT